jgi:hypothetical protein
MTGKTQIAKELAHRTGIPYFKASSEHQAFISSRQGKNELFLNQLRYADMRVFDVLKQTGQSIILDRGYPCEWVYSGQFNRETDELMVFHEDESYASLGAKIVVCIRSSYVGIVDDIDDKITAPVLEELTDGYQRFLSWTKCESKLLYVDDEDLDREVNELMEFLGEK